MCILYIGQRLIFLSLQLLEKTNKAAAYARQWMRAAQDAARGGKLLKRRTK